jgi:hypothetical protein
MVGDAHQRLGGEMKHARDLVLGERAGDQLLLADVAADGVDLPGAAQELERGRRRLVAADGHHAVAAVQQRRGEPRAQQPVRAGDEDGLRRGQRGRMLRYVHRFHGAAPEPHRSLRATASL